MTINTCLEKIEDITRQNLELLKTINQAFTTKHEHLSVNINDTQYIVPSFISLENKINTLQHNLENIVNAPTTGECFTYFDGTTQRLELSGYSTTPVQTQPVDTTNDRNEHLFGVDSNDIFKDFMNPMPYSRILLNTIPNNVKTLCVKKIALKNPQLIDLVKNELGTQNPDYNIDEMAVVNIDYGTIKAMLYNFIEDVDFVDYDTIRRIPIRKSQGYGVYGVETINRVWEDSDFTQYYDVTLNKELIYTINDGTIDRNIKVGDKLVTSNSRVLCEVTEVHPASRTLTLKVLYGGYVDLTTADQSTQLGTLMFYSSIDFDNTKYIDVPLEEDQYVCVFIAAVNDTTNTRGAWGQGLFYNTDNLVIYLDGADEPVKFRKYYNEHVNNIGDTLYDLTKFMNSSLYNMTMTEMENVLAYKPVIETDNLTVTQINKHLNDSDTVQKIRNLYNQKAKYKTELDTVQASIDNINDILSTIAFDVQDTNRAMYESQLSEYNTKKAELTASIVSIANEINANVNAADTPIENAKYHIRGFVDVTIPDELKVEGTPFEVIKIDVEYRYKNRNKMSGNAETIGENNEIFSDWNKMDSVYREKLLKYNAEGTLVFPYQFELEPTNDDINVISFNQIDIPITQGEIVDIRYRYEYSLGFPFVKVYSDWSDIYTQTFPDEYLQNATILSIIEENNNDIKNNAVNELLREKGLIDHEEDKLIDQNITYFHKPEHIASGFYTEERRVIPLYDILQSMHSDISEMMSEVYGSLGNNLVVSVYDEMNSVSLPQNTNTTFFACSYLSNENKQKLVDIIPSATGAVTEWPIAYTQININLYNGGTYPIRLHSLFPGDPNAGLAINTPGKYNWRDYTGNDSSEKFGVWMQHDGADGNSEPIKQRLNQFMYFRYRKAIGNDIIYNKNTIAFGLPDSDDKNLPTYANLNSVFPLIQSFDDAYHGAPSRPPYLFISVFPYLSQDSKLIINDPNTDYIVINPGESVDIPLSMYYYIDPSEETDAEKNPYVIQHLEFDLRTSLFADPVTYKMDIKAFYNDTAAKKGMKKIVSFNAEGVASPKSAAQRSASDIRRTTVTIGSDGTARVKARRR